MFKTDLQKFQFYDKYSRFDLGLERKETWEETVQRTVNYLRELSDNQLEEFEYLAIFQAIKNMDVMPSMRMLAMAGDAARRDNACIYNCSYLPIVDLFAFTEMLRLCMNGVGVGFSVELPYIEGLPFVEKQVLEYEVKTIQIADSTNGWCQALDQGVEAWYSGHDIQFDYSLIREPGSILRTKGGRASGPKPLKDLLDFTRDLILSKQGQRLSSIDVYDIICKIGDAVIMGGVRRVAFLCLFSYNDIEMLHVKDGDFWNSKPWRGNSNNSRVWPNRKLSYNELRAFFLEMDDGKNGEPGIFSREAVKNTMPSRRVFDIAFGLNPCGEIILKPFQFCNLASVVCKTFDTLETLIEKVKIATLISTIQSLGTHFLGLRPEWKENCINERLLGVDLNGQMDSEIARLPEVQRKLRQVAIDANKYYAQVFDINESAAITTVKPSGNSGVLLDTASGLHPRWSDYYIRHLTVNEDTTLYKVLKQSDVELIHYSGTKWLVTFYVKSPDGAITRHELNAMKQLDYWKQVKVNYTEHNPSCTIYYTDSEKEDVIQWLYDNQNIVSGLSFYPRDNAVYENAPYVEITEEEYNNATQPSIDFSLMHTQEKYDYEQYREFACGSGACDMQL